MKVRALQRGFHVTIREPGEEFDIQTPVPLWCEKVAGKQAGAPSSAQAGPDSGTGNQSAPRFKAKHNGPGPGVGAGNWAVENTDDGSRASVVFKKADGDAKEKAEAEASRLNDGGDIDLGVMDDEPSSAPVDTADTETETDLPDA